MNKREMNSSIVRALVVITALSVAVPESQARRMGSGRSAGRQSQMFKRQVPPSSAPATPPAHQPGPDIARQSVPPLAPQPPSRPPSRWGSMLGGALVGLGLGSLLSHSSERGATDASGASGTSGESGVSDADANATQRASEEQGSGIGNVLLLGLLAVAVMWLVRRARRRKSRYESEKSQLRRF